MKKIILLAIPLIAVAGWYFYVRYDNDSQAGAILYSLSRTINYCNDGIATKKTYLDYGRCQNDLKYDRERTEKLKKWAVSQEKLDRIAATQQKAEKAVEDYANFVEQKKKQQREAEEAKEKAEQIAADEWRAKREAEAQREAETKQKYNADLKKISEAVTAAKRPGGATAPAGRWPLADPWPNDLKPRKVLIWDQKKQAVHASQQKLRDGLGGSPTDDELLICAVTDERLQPVVEYKQDAFRRRFPGESDATITGKVAGHRMWQFVRLVKYPEGELIGAYTIVGDAPKHEVYVAVDKRERKEIVGEHEYLLAKWLRERFAPAGPVEKFLAASDSGAAGNLAQEIGKDSQVIGSTSLPYLARKLKAATDPAMQYAVIRVVQAAKREHPDYVPPTYAPGYSPPAGEPPPPPPNIGPPSYAAFLANPRRWLININDWLKVQAPVE